MSGQTIDVGTHAAATAIPLKVVVIEGPDEGQERPLVGVLEIGTGENCGLVLHDAAVSKQHVMLTTSQNKVVVRDLGSRNGVFLGGTRIKDAEIPIGAVLQIGRSAIAIQARWYAREIQPSIQRQFGDLIGESLAMREVFAILERAAPAEVTVLIEGESGTGKELAARSIHKASPRAKGPYVVFDCGSVPAELAESELFGHKKGAFSGATADRTGAFQRAHGGTLCLDELGELPLDLQPKLLRALETGEVRSVGSDEPRKVDVRLIASTNRDLHAEARRGQFRSDLFYRLEVLRVRIPPLRQRPEDVPGLVMRLLDGKLPAGDEVTGPNLRRLIDYGWPGNVRELRNALQRAVTLANQPGKPPAKFSALVFNLGPASSTPITIGTEFPGVGTSVPYKDAKEQLIASFDRLYMATLLDRHRGNISAAARVAGLSRKHLYELMKKTGLSTEESEATED